MTCSSALFWSWSRWTRSFGAQAGRTKARATSRGAALHILHSLREPGVLPHELGEPRRDARDGELGLLASSRQAGPEEDMVHDLVDEALCLMTRRELFRQREPVRHSVVLSAD